MSTQTACCGHEDDPRGVDGADDSDATKISGSADDSPVISEIWGNVCSKRSASSKRPITQCQLGLLLGSLLSHGP